MGHVPEVCWITCNCKANYNRREVPESKNRFTQQAARLFYMQFQTHQESLSSVVEVPTLNQQNLSILLDWVSFSCCSTARPPKLLEQDQPWTLKRIQCVRTEKMAQGHSCRARSHNVPPCSVSIAVVSKGQLRQFTKEHWLLTIVNRSCCCRCLSQNWFRIFHGCAVSKRVLQTLASLPKIEGFRNLVPWLLETRDPQPWLCLKKGDTFKSWGWSHSFSTAMVFVFGFSEILRRSQQKGSSSRKAVEYLRCHTVVWRRDWRDLFVAWRCFFAGAATF